MALTREEVEHIARLARLGLTEADKDKFRNQLSNILEQFQTLQEVDTTDIVPTAQVTDLQNVMRQDKILPSLKQEDVLANAPWREQEYFRVRAVLEE